MPNMTESDVANRKAARKWYREVARAYDNMLAEMEADGWTVHNRGGRFGLEYLTKDGKAVRIVRQPGSSEWYTVEVT